MKIAGSRALVSGGASGLGEAVVEALMARGAQVASLDLMPSGKATVSQIADVRKEDELEQAINAAAQAMGGIDLVFNCAGIGMMMPVWHEGQPGDLAHFQRLFDVNLAGTWNVIRLALRHMTQGPVNELGERGVIVNTASISAMDGPAGFAAYSATKAGVVAMTGPLALDLGPLGIRVCAIAPGMFETPLLANLPDEVKAGFVRHMVFPKRAGNPARFADLALHIVENDYLNGATIRIDAGARAPLPN